MEEPQVNAAEDQTPELTEEEKAYGRAKMRAEAKILFFIHLGVYLGVNALLGIVNALTWTGYPWCLWPLAGWGVGVFIHGLVVFTATSKIKERMIEKEMTRDDE